MGDEGLKNVLTDLQLEEYIETFQKNKITTEILKQLSEEMITELIPLIGPRAIFLSYWKKHYQCPLRSIENDTGNISLMRKRSKSNCDDEIIDMNSVVPQTIVSKKCSNQRLSETDVRPIHDILEECVQGQRILKAYMREKELTEKSRNRICDMIITDLENRNKCLRNVNAEYIANMIVAAFPTEVLSTYYIPPIKKKDSVLKKSIPARGKIISMWRNRTFVTNKFNISMEPTAPVLDDNTNDVENTENKSSIEWLEKNQAPWELVDQHWCKTFNIRRKTFESSREKTLVDVFTQWPILKHPNGLSLILQDFERMGLSKETLTMDKWTKFFEPLRNVLTLASKDDTGNVLMETLQDEISNDSKIALEVMMLSHLIPPKKMQRCNKKYWKPSIWNAKDSMIKHAVIPGDVTRLREEALKRCKELKITIQPYVIIVGSSLKEIKNSYVCIDDILYTTTSTVESIDTCFKTFHVLGLNYPVASEHIWLLIQKCIYKFTTKWDNIIPYIEYIINKFVIVREKNYYIESTPSTSKSIQVQK